MTSPTVLGPKITKGFRTSEFWFSTVAPALLSIATLIFHRDFSSYVPAVAIGASALSAAVYAVSRANLKKPVDLASLLFDVKALLPVAKSAAETVAEVRKAAPAKAAPAASVKAKAAPLTTQAVTASPVKTEVTVADIPAPTKQP